MWKKLFRPRTPEEYAEKASAALDRDDVQTALQLAEECVERFSNIVDARLLHSMMLASVGRTDEAVATMDAVAERYPTTAWLRKATILKQAGRVAEALDAYAKAVQSDDQYVDGWLAWGAALASAGEHSQALKKLDRARDLAPTRSEILLRLGRSLGCLARTPEALDCYEQALELGDASAHVSIRSSLLALGRVTEANERRTKNDPQGEAREQRKSLKSRSLVARYFLGQHSQPELLDAVVEGMLDHVARLESVPPGLSDGITIQYAFTRLEVREDGSDLILCEPDWSNQPLQRSKPEVSFSAMQLVMTQVLHELTSAESEDCSCHHTIILEKGALEAERVVMQRSAPLDPDDSGWRVLCTGASEFPSVKLPLAALVELRPEFLKVVSLPVGWRVHMHAHEIDRVLDSLDNDRYPTADR